MAQAYRTRNQKFSLSPWQDSSFNYESYNEQELSVNQSNQRRKNRKIKPDNILTLKKIQIEENQLKSAIRLKDYSLPPLNYRTSIRPTNNETTKHLSKNTTKSKIDSDTRKFNTIAGEINLKDKKFRLNGRKCTQVQHSFKETKWFEKSFESKSTNYNTITPHALLFSQKKQDVLKRVLDQIQLKFK